MLINIAWHPHLEHDTLWTTHNWCCQSNMNWQPVNHPHLSISANGYLEHYFCNMHRKLRNVCSSQASWRYALNLINTKYSCTLFMNQFPFSSWVHAATVNHNWGISTELSISAIRIGPWQLSIKWVLPKTTCTFDRHLIYFHEQVSAVMLMLHTMSVPLIVRSTTVLSPAHRRSRLIHSLQKVRSCQSWQPVSVEPIRTFSDQTAHIQQHALWMVQNLLYNNSCHL